MPSATRTRPRADAAATSATVPASNNQPLGRPTPGATRMPLTSAASRHNGAAYTSHRDEVVELCEFRRPDAAYPAEIIDRAKRAVLFPFVHDRGGGRGTDPGQLVELLG